MFVQLILSQWLKFPSKFYFFIFCGVRFKNFVTFGEVFCALLPTLHFASSAHHSDVFSEQFSLLTPLGVWATKFRIFWSKGFQTIVKMASTCTDGHKEMKLVFGQKKFYFFYFWTLGIIKRTFGSKNRSAPFPEMTSTCAEGNFEVIRGSRIKQKFFEFFWDWSLKFSEIP